MLASVVVREPCLVLSQCPASPSHTEPSERSGPACPTLGVTHHVAAELGPEPQQARVWVSASHTAPSRLPSKNPVPSERVSPNDVSVHNIASHRTKPFVLYWIKSYCSKASICNERPGRPGLVLVLTARWPRESHLLSCWEASSGFGLLQD